MSKFNPAPQSRDVRPVPVQHGYDQWSAIYDEEDNSLIGLEELHLPPLLGDVAGRDVLELGCGTGRHAARLAQQGARMTAVDFSAGMVAKAASKPGWDRVRFVQHDLSKPLPFAEGAYDLVLSALVLEHLANLDLFFRECARVVRPRGDVTLSAMHPAMMLRGVTAHFTDPATGQDVHPRSQPHQISDFLMASVRANLRLVHIGEHAIGREQAATNPRAAKYEGWPMLLLMKFTR
jgi:malonyl-CoA O-methyltransferase